MRKLLIVTLFLLNSACFKTNEIKYFHATIPEFVIEHAQAICHTHDGVRNIDVTARRIRRGGLTDYEVYCADVIMTCNGDSIEATYDTCDKKWYKDLKQ